MADSGGLIPQAQYDQILSLVPIVCVDVAIVHNGLVLLIKRDQEPAKGEWWLPGGRLHKGESLRYCAVRKTKEETGLDCAPLSMIHYDETQFPTPTPIHSINFCYMVMVLGQEPVSDGSWTDYQWVDNTRTHTLHPYVRKCLDEVFYGGWF